MPQKELDADRPAPSQRREAILQDVVSARIAERPQLAEQSRSRNPIRRAGLYSLVDVMFIGVKLARSRFTPVTLQPVASQTASTVSGDTSSIPVISRIL